MSYFLDGVRYDSYAEYQAAKSRRDSRRVEEELRRARSRARDLSARIDQQNRQLGEAHDNLDRQTQLNEELRVSVGELGASQEHLRQSQQAMVRRVESEFDDLRQDAAALGEDVAELEQAHREHVRQVQQAFEEVQEEIEAAFEEAEERRRQTEQRLNAEIRRVDAKVEADRRERLQKVANERARAEDGVGQVSSALQEVEGQLEPLGLQEEAQSIRDQLASAKESLSRNESGAALAIANGTFADARTLRYRIRKRAAALAAQRESVLARADGLLKSLEDATVKEWFPQEATRATAALHRVLDRAQRGYARHAAMEVEKDRDERDLAELERSVTTMVASAPGLAEAGQERKEVAKKLVEKLARVYGPLSDVRSRFSGSDPKEPLVVECMFGGARVDIHLALDGGYTIDGYGHSSNVACADKAQSVLREIQADQKARLKDVSQDNRTTPAVAEQRPEGKEWQGVQDSLDQIDRSR